MAGPLDGIVVADFSRVLAGPYATMLMADMGATVVKVESPAGDDTRAWMPPEHDGKSTYYMSINRNKKSVTLDLRDADDLALAVELMARADVAVENFKPGGLAKFGLDYESVAPSNPSLVYLSITGFGTGEGASLPGYDLIVQGTSGLMSMTGEADGPGYRAGIALFDVMAGLHGLYGVLAALHQRNSTGEGQLVEVSLMASAMSGLVNHSGAYSIAGATPHRMGNGHPSLYPYEPFPTADRDVIIAVGNDTQFVALCELLEIPEVAVDERFATNTGRTANRDELRELMVAALASWSADDLFESLNAVGVPCGPINSIAEGVEMAESLGLSPRATVGEGDRQVDTVRNPVSFGQAEMSYTLPPPEVGEHSEEIRSWLQS